MIGVDTNVLIRFFVDDDPEQNRVARTLLAERTAHDPAFISAVTLAETVWVLTKRLGYSKRDVAVMVVSLLEADGAVVQHGDELGSLLAGGDMPDVEFADYLIAWSGLAAGCSKTVTFDKRSAKAISSMELLA